MGVQLRLLMIEDSEDDAALVLRELRRGDYDVQMERVDESSALESVFEKQNWDLRISDLSMPHFSGPEALRTLRSKSPCPPAPHLRHPWNHRGRNRGGRPKGWRPRIT